MKRGKKRKEQTKSLLEPELAFFLVLLFCLEENRSVLKSFVLFFFSFFLKEHPLRRHRRRLPLLRSRERGVTKMDVNGSFNEFCLS